MSTDDPCPDCGRSDCRYVRYPDATTSCDHRPDRACDACLTVILTALTEECGGYDDVPRICAEHDAYEPCRRCALDELAALGQEIGEIDPVDLYCAEHDRHRPCRACEKQTSRDRDAADLASGAKTREQLTRENGVVAAIAGDYDIDSAERLW